MVVVFSIIIEHSKDCKQFKTSNKIVDNIEVIRRQLVFNDCKQVNNYWRKLSKEKNIAKNKISFLMFCDCILK